jgi:hypothetical protein
MFLNVFTLKRPMQFLEVSTLQGPELHLDLSALQRSALLLEVSATGPELHLDVSALQRSVLLLFGGVYTTGAWAACECVCTTEECTAPGGVSQGPELHLDVSALQQRSVPLLEVSTLYCRMCSLRFENKLLTVGCVHFASKLISYYRTCSLCFESSFLSS